MNIKNVLIQEASFEPEVRCKNCLLLIEDYDDECYNCGLIMGGVEHGLV